MSDGTPMAPRSVSQIQFGLLNNLTVLIRQAKQAELRMTRRIKQHYAGSTAPNTPNNEASQCVKS